MQVADKFTLSIPVSWAWSPDGSITAQGRDAQRSQVSPSQPSAVRAYLEWRRGISASFDVFVVLVGQSRNRYRSRGRVIDRLCRSRLHIVRSVLASLTAIAQMPMCHRPDDISFADRASPPSSHQPRRTRHCQWTTYNIL